jgi:hypothetical protein
MATMVTMQTPPKLVYDDAGQLVEVIFSTDDYLIYLADLPADPDA